MMKIFDTHAHYNSKEYTSDINDVLKKLKENGVDKVCEASASLDDSINVQSFLSKFNYDNKNFPYIYHSIGIHPDEIKNYQYGTKEFDDYFKRLESCINADKAYDEENVSYSDYCLCSKLEHDLRDKRKFFKPVAIGEIGLDYYGEKDDDAILNQKLWFIEQIKLAKKYDLPIIVHSRDACKDTLDIIKEYANNYHGIIHCFSYESEIAKEYIKMGYMIGVGGVITYKNGRKLQEVVNDIDINNIVTETDSPYLAPEPHRGTRNDSSNIIYVIDKISEIKNIDKEKLADSLYDNAIKIFNIK